MDNDIPLLRRPEDMPPVHTQADLHQHWRAIIGELGFGETSLWLLFFESDGRCTPVVQQVADLPDVPDPEILTNLMWVCDEVLRACLPGGSVAFLLSRPGDAGITPSDQAWASRLISAAREAGVPCHALHVANDHELRAFTPDDAIAS